MLFRQVATNCKKRTQKRFDLVNSRRTRISELVLCHNYVKYRHSAKSTGKLLYDHFLFFWFFAKSFCKKTFVLLEYSSCKTRKHALKKFFPINLLWNDFLASFGSFLPLCGGLRHIRWTDFFFPVAAENVLPSVQDFQFFFFVGNQNRID